MENLIIKPTETEQRAKSAQGMAEIILGFLSSIHGKEKLLKYFEFVSESDQFSNEAIAFAKEYLSQENLWGKGLESGLKQ